MLDDDPTGSQTVHGVAVSTVDGFAEVLAEPGASCFVLTNTRSMTQAAAVEFTTHIATQLFELERASGEPLEVVSRSDSTLRGHVLAEVAALNSARRTVLGRGFDGVVFAPAYFEAGRFTTDDIHFATVDGRAVPVGQTEFARDASFGYRSSDLREFLAEKNGGPLAADQVLSIGLDDIRTGGVDRVTEILARAHQLAFVVVNATGYADLDVVVSAVRRLESDGRRFLFRTGPSFVRSLLGVEERARLTEHDLWGDEQPGHGLVVVGSHVGQTGRQLARLIERVPLARFELDVAALLAAPGSDAVSELAAQVRTALGAGDVLLTTSRSLVRDDDPDRSLRIAGTVSEALTAVVRAALAAHPSWVLAKGGITSHDVAVHGLGIRRSTVLGQFFPGMVSALRIDQAADPDARGIRFVVFAGNVGDDDALAEVVARLSRSSRRPGRAAPP